jgi:hypothetical protein
MALIRALGLQVRQRQAEPVHAFGAVGREARIVLADAPRIAHHLGEKQVSRPVVLLVPAASRARARARVDGGEVLALGDWVALAMIGKELPRVGFVSPSTEKLPECPSATPACRLTSYVVPGDRVLVGDPVDGFRCATFRSSNGRDTSGFLPSAAADRSVHCFACSRRLGRPLGPG